MSVHTLIALDGALYFPRGGIDDSGRNDPSKPSMLLRRYDAGDCDICRWPFTPADTDLRECLAIALYDERETNSEFRLNDAINLPDGEPFDFDQVLDRNVD